ncbi:MAG: hypothetical protein K2X93_04500 [Candidatus Obscuribacterales bacterium]|nr:hypothetical protein [Candidatus Obscuribacterales bacterium]
MKSYLPPGAGKTTPVVFDTGTPTDDSLFFEIYDFDTVPPSLERLAEINMAPDVVSTKIVATHKSSQLQEQ